MKQSPLTTALLVLLAVSALVSVGLCYSYVSNARELRKLQADAAMVNNNRALINALANDAVEYSKKNKDIDPILESAGIKPSHAGVASSAAHTATK